jgi:hypothetical protein
MPVPHTYQCAPLSRRDRADRAHHSTPNPTTIQPRLPTALFNPAFQLSVGHDSPLAESRPLFASSPGPAAALTPCIGLARAILHQDLYHPEFKFAGPDGNPCDPWTRGVLQSRHIVAGGFNYCGKEFKRKLEQGPVDHELAVRCKVYENGRVAADPKTLRQVAQFSEREISKGTGRHRKPIRLLRHGGTVTHSTY